MGDISDSIRQGIENIKDKGFNSRTIEERQELAKKAGIASGEARRKKKNMRETAKMLLEMQVVGDTNKRNLEAFGIKEEDQNYQTAILVRTLQKALVEGDVSSVKLLGELTGDINKFFNLVPDDDGNIVEMVYPQICLPDNGRDKLRGNVLCAQSGPQTMFMASNADIVIYGGAAGGGKTFALLLEALRHQDVKNFGAVIFRKNFTQVTAEGGLWDASHKIFDQVAGAISKKTPKLHWEFNNGQGAKLTFAHIEREDSLASWQGTEIAYLGFDELTHFSRHQFLYMLSRNRTTCGIRPYVRATCNPDADSWVADFISWWIDQDTGYPIPERSGMVRYMAVISDIIYWADTPEQLVAQHEGDITVDDCKSVTFIASSLKDNKILVETDPGYMANLKALTEVDMERLLYGNWKIKPSAGRYFKREQVEIIDVIPADITEWVRAWDLAATDESENDDADYTASCLMGKRPNGMFVVVEAFHKRIKAGDVEKLVLNTTKMDAAKIGYGYTIRMPQDPGAAGKTLAKQYIKLLAGYNIKVLPVSGSKETRATPFAAQWQNGNVQIVSGFWNEEYLNELESFPDSKHDDMVDASSDAFSELAEGRFNISSLI